MTSGRFRGRWRGEERGGGYCSETGLMTVEEGRQASTSEFRDKEESNNSTLGWDMEVIDT